MSNEVFVGLDWAVHTHAVCLIDATGSVLDRFEVTHDRDGLAELMRRLARHGARLRIAIERPSGLIVDALVDAGHEVFPIHPNAVKASRPRYRSHGAKSDASDAYLLADLLRTDGHRWRALAPQSDDIRALRALVRSRDDLVAARVAAANQLTSTTTRSNTPKISSGFSQTRMEPLLLHSRRTTHGSQFPVYPPFHCMAI